MLNVVPAKRAGSGSWGAIFVAACFAFGSSASGDVGTAPPAFPPATRDCPDCPEMRPVTIDTKAGRRTLMVGIYELTWQEYMVSVDEADCPKPQNNNGDVDIPLDFSNGALRDRYPMTSLPPSEFKCYLDWIKRRTGKPYRLPTEAEWIGFASIGVPGKSLLSGAVPPNEAYLSPGSIQFDYDTHTDDYIKAASDQRRPIKSRLVTKVGRYFPSTVGLYDLFGNAAEVVSDYITPNEFMTNMKSKYHRCRVKGGSQSLDVNDNVILSQHNFLCEFNNQIVGFRLVY